MSNTIQNMFGRQRDRIVGRRRRPIFQGTSSLERLDARVLLSTMTAAGVSFDDSTNTFTSDGAAHTLTLYEVPQGDGSTDLGFTVDDASTGLQVTTVPITPSGPPAITVNLGNGGNTLSLDGSWTFTDPVTFTGGTGGDTVDDTNLLTSNTWHLTGGGAGDINGPSGLSFSSVSQVNGTPADILTGDSSDSTWTLVSSGANTYGDGTITTAFTGFGTLVGSNNNTFDINGDAPVSGSDPGLGVINYNLTGGNGANTFAFINSPQLQGTIDGSAGTSHLDLSQFTSPTSIALTGSGASGYSGSDSALVTGDFMGISSILANSGQSDTLTGEDVASTWSLGGTQTYNDGTSALTFANFSTLAGGSAADAFNVTVGTTASLEGGGGSDTLNLSGYASGENVVLTGYDATGSAVGFSGTTSSATGAFTGINVLTGVSSDTLTGDDNASTWSLGASMAYQETGGSDSLGFSGFGTLQGGSAADAFNVTANTTANLKGGAGGDSFVFSAGTALTGTVDGQGGTDTLDLSAYTTALSVALTGSDSTNGFAGTGGVTGGFAGINVLTSGSSAGDTLTGENVASTWSLGATPAYGDGTATLTFANFETLQGGSAADAFNVTANTTANLKGGAGGDSFVFSAGTALTGTVDGQGGTDTLDLSAYTTALSVALTGSDSTNGFAGTGGVTGGFAGINVLTSGSSAGDTLTGENVASTWSLGATPAYGDGTATLTFANFETLQGGSAADAFNILANNSASLYGGGGNDSFVFSDGMSSTGTIDGQGGNNTLDYSAYTTPVSMNLGTHKATATNAFANIQAMVGGVAATSTLVGANTTNAWSVTGANAGSVTGGSAFSFTRVGNLTGGLLNDTFTFSSGASVVGSVNGGSGTNSLDFHLYTTAVSANVTGTNAGTITGTGGFSSIANLTGGSVNDTFALASGKTLTGKIDGSTGSNTLDYSAYSTAVRVNLKLNAAIGVFNGANAGIANIQNVTGGGGDDVLTGDDNANVLIGGGGNNILVGNGGSDILTGGPSNDILIGGDGSDTINGGSGNEMMIASRTDYDNNTAALSSLMAEWSRTDVSYATKISHLTGATTGGRNGSIVLTGTTVHNDPAAIADALFDGGGLDWFIVPNANRVHTSHAGEVITVI